MRLRLEPSRESFSSSVRVVQSWLRLDFSSSRESIARRREVLIAIVSIILNMEGDEDPLL